MQCERQSLINYYDNDDDDYDYDYGDDYDVGTLMNRIKQIYADFHKKTDLLNRRNLRVPTPKLFQIDFNSRYKIGTKIKDN